MASNREGNTVSGTRHVVPPPIARRVPKYSLAFTATLAVLFAAANPALAQRAAVAPEWNLQTLMATMRTVRSSSARFVETKDLHLLNQAQRSSGQLNYVAPNYLQKTTTEPRSARLTISGDRLVVEQQGERTREISLRDYSEIGALVESIRATLAGDLPSLASHFTTSLEGGPNGWTITLVPREAKLREMVTMIRIQGDHGAIRDVLTQEADGDRTDMVVLPDQK